LRTSGLSNSIHWLAVSRSCCGTRVPQQSQWQQLVGAAQVGAAGAQQLGAAGAQHFGASTQQAGAGAQQVGAAWQQVGLQQRGNFGMRIFGQHILKRGLQQLTGSQQGAGWGQQCGAGAAHAGAQAGAQGAAQVGAAGAQQLGSGAQQLRFQNALTSAVLTRQTSSAAAMLDSFIRVFSSGTIGDRSGMRAKLAVAFRSVSRQVRPGLPPTAYHRTRVRESHAFLRRFGMSIPTRNRPRDSPPNHVAPVVTAVGPTCGHPNRRSQSSPLVSRQLPMSRFTDWGNLLGLRRGFRRLRPSGGFGRSQCPVLLEERPAPHEDVTV
jgi:hypothetical protein